MTPLPGARRALVLQHVPWETPGLIGAALADAGVGVETRIVLDDPAPDLPAPADLAALVVLGGPMGALDDAAHPGLAAERALLAACTHAAIPVLGVCLGMQLLAVAHGAGLHPGHGTEVGYAPVEVLADDPLLAPLGPSPTVLHWHSDAVDLPPGAELLARTAATPVQGFRMGSAVGLQFHVEVDAALLATWLATPAMARELADVEAVRTEAGRVLPDLVPPAAAGLATFAGRAASRASGPRQRAAG